MRSSDGTLACIEMQVLFQNSLNSALMNRNLKRETSRDVDIGCETGPFNSCTMRTIAVGVCVRLHGVPKCNLFHMTSLTDDLACYSQTLEYLKSSGLESICLTGFQRTRLGVQTEK